MAGPQASKASQGRPQATTDAEKAPAAPPSGADLLGAAAGSQTAPEAEQTPPEAEKAVEPAIDAAKVDAVAAAKAVDAAVETARAEAEKLAAEAASAGEQVEHGAEAAETIVVTGVERVSAFEAEIHDTLGRMVAWAEGKGHELHAALHLAHTRAAELLVALRGAESAAEKIDGSLAAALKRLRSHLA